LIEQIRSYKTLFFNSDDCELCIFTSDEQGPACHAYKNLYDHPECSLSFMSLAPLLQRNTHHVTLRTSTAWSPETFSKR